MACSALTLGGRSLLWTVLNDGVMGGRSCSRVEALHDGGIRFEGIINTDGGGFASTRGVPESGAELGLSEGSGFVVEARGDGNRYKLTLQTHQTHRNPGVSYQHDFVTSGRSETEHHHLPLSGFKLQRRGVPIAAPPPRIDEIVGVGFMLSIKTADGKPSGLKSGPFSLEVATIKATTDLN